MPGGVVVPVVWSRELPSAPSSVRVYRDSLGHWYASFVVKLSALTSIPASSEAIGVDWGVAKLAITTNPAYDLVRAQHGQRAAARLAHYQRRMARRRPPPGKRASRGYRAANASPRRPPNDCSANAATTPASGRTASCTLMASSPSRTSDRPSSRSRGWHARPPTARSPRSRRCSSSRRPSGTPRRARRPEAHDHGLLQLPRESQAAVESVRTHVPLPGLWGEHGP